MFVVYINYPLTISNNLIYNALILKRLIYKQKNLHVLLKLLDK